MISITSFIICFGLCLMKTVGQPLNIIPLTLYRPDFNDPCGNSDSGYDYFDIAFCRNGVPPNATQLQVSLEIPENPDFEPAPPARVICIQLSKCKNDFSQACVFATNYVITNFVVNTFGDLVINTDRFCPDITNCTIYMRAMAQPIATQYSVELIFVNSKPEKYSGWTEDLPWKETTPSVPVTQLSQYWRSDQIYERSYNQFTYFYIGYCAQNAKIDEIELAVVSPTNNTKTLLQAYACPKNSVNSNYLECQVEAAKSIGFYAPYVAPFFVLPCKDTANTPLTNGLYVTVNTFGNSSNPSNEFIIQAIIDPPSSQIGYDKRKK